MSILLHPLPPGPDSDLDSAIGLVPLSRHIQVAADVDDQKEITGGPPPGVKEIVGVPENKDARRESNASVEMVDLESGLKRTTRKSGGDCRICHLSIDATDSDSYELGCCCKDDLATAHKQCAEVWFKIKGNKTCEICGSTAQNVSGETEEGVLIRSWDDTLSRTSSEATRITETEQQPARFWRGHRFLNFIMVFMVLAFVVSWLFHFHIHAP